MRERDQIQSSHYSSSRHSSSTSTTPMPHVIPPEGMTMTYLKMPNGDYVWTIHKEKGVRDRSRRSTRDHGSKNNLDANHVFEDENLIIFGDFNISTLLGLD